MIRPTSTANPVLTQIDGDLRHGKHIPLLGKLRPATHIAGVTFLTRVAATDTWTLVAPGTGAAVANDATLGLFATSTARLTAGVDLSSYASYRSGTLATPIDLSGGKSILVWYRNTGSAPISTFEVTAYSGTGTANAMKWDFNVLPPGADDAWIVGEYKGDWGTATGTWDPTNITAIWVNNVGPGQSQINVGAVAIRPASTLYPNGVATICLDDSDATAASNALVKLSQYNYPAVLAIVLDLIGTTGRLTLAQIQQLHDTLGWEVAGHSDTLSNHAIGFTKLPLGTLNAAFEKMRAWQIANGFDDSIAWASPQGLCTTREWRAAQRAGYGLHRFADAGAGQLGSRQSAGAWTTPSAIRSRSFSSTSGDTTARVQTDIDRAKSLKGHFVLTCHLVGGATEGASAITAAHFGTIIDYINTVGMPVRTFKQIADEVAAGQLLY